jgi:hypothetical protein
VARNWSLTTRQFPPGRRQGAQRAIERLDLDFGEWFQRVRERIQFEYRFSQLSRNQFTELGPVPAREGDWIVQCPEHQLIAGRVSAAA